MTLHTATPVILAATRVIASGLLDPSRQLKSRSTPSDKITGKLAEQMILAILAGIDPLLMHPRDGDDLGTRSSILASCLEGLEDTGKERKGTAPSYLHRFALTASGSLHLPRDKTGRWIGYIEGVSAGHGRPITDLEVAPSEEMADMTSASHALGFVQGLLIAKGVLELDLERDRTRPILHEAYRTIGISPPASVDISDQGVVVRSKT